MKQKTVRIRWKSLLVEWDKAMVKVKLKKVPVKEKFELAEMLQKNPRYDGDC